MNAIVGHIRGFRVMMLALVVLVLGGLGQGLPGHAGMTGDAAGLSAMLPMPMDHAGMDGMSDADKAVCELRCLIPALGLPGSPAVAVRTGHAGMARPQAVLLPVAHVSGPDGPPPRQLA